MNALTWSCLLLALAAAPFTARADLNIRATACKDDPRCLSANAAPAVVVLKPVVVVPAPVQVPAEPLVTIRAAIPAR